MRKKKGCRRGGEEGIKYYGDGLGLAIATTIGASVLSDQGSRRNVSLECYYLLGEELPYKFPLNRTLFY